MVYIVEGDVCYLPQPVLVSTASPSDPPHWAKSVVAGCQKGGRTEESELVSVDRCQAAAHIFN